ncbi:MAG: hypothetical protein Q8Q87_04525, partial [Candidatus Omnitrophota bacterium]|nr:hypothetical protein [Candidatus Omnitrophota bacterium]
SVERLPAVCLADLRQAGMAYREKILKDVPSSSYMYFVHSYYVKPKDKGVVLTTTDYGIEFVSGVCKDNIYGFQFHPEKSQDIGLRILKNFVNISPKRYMLSASATKIGGSAYGGKR